MSEVLYFIEHPSPRARYVVRHVLRTMLGWDASEIMELPSAGEGGPPLLIYGRVRNEGAFHVVPSPSERPVASKDAEALFPSPEGSDLCFDPFATAFFFLTRIEEYSSMPVDEHGRVRSADLFQVRCGLLMKPFVDELVIRFAEVWRSGRPDLPQVRRAYRQVVTMDVDNGFMFKGRPLWRTLGAGARDLLHGDLKRFAGRVATLRGTKSDPYDIYDDFRKITEGQAERVILNFLVAPRGRYDHAVGVADADMRERMQRAASWAEIGIHPSYGSSEDLRMLQEELKLLQDVIKKPVEISRQHFLRFRLPSTFNELIRASIKEDHSMGLADTIGFRCGTCTPFPFYDVEKDEETGLMMHPFAVMDSALAYKMGLTPAQALVEVQSIVDEVKRVRGTFIGVWHERFVSDYGTEAGWRNVVEASIEYART